MNQSKRCLVCKQNFLQAHFFYEGLCPSCGDLNYAKRDRFPDLHGKIALVTGARIKIGYAVALRLLRAGARVIVTTRFPRDAASRYVGESDFNQWSDRLQIYRLDLRHLPTVETFTHHVINCYPRLDIIINNAAQTIRRPPAFYQHLLPFESFPLEQLPPEIKRLLGEAIAAFDLLSMRSMLRRESATRFISELARGSMYLVNCLKTIPNRNGSLGVRVRQFCN